MAPRSRTGCLTCRSRKLKCSEERPVCAQCVKANRECIPSSGITFRHQQNPSMNGGPVAEGSLKRFYGYKETFDKQTIWLPIPQGLTFVHTSNPYDDEEGAVTNSIDGSTILADNMFDRGGRQHSELSLSQALYPQYATHGLEALSAVASQDQYNYGPVPTATLQQDMASSALDNPLANSDNHSPNLDFMLNNSASLSSPTNIDPRLHTPTASQPDSQEHSQSPHHVRTLSSYSSTRPVSLLSQGKRTTTPTTTIHDRELSFFLRDFSERTGHWMDIFDLDCFFGVHVPALANRCPLLLNSCAALSAKSLARVSGRKPMMNGQASFEGRSKMEFWPGPAMSREDWVRKSREYYDLAVSLLRRALAGSSRPQTAEFPASMSQQNTSAIQSDGLPTPDSEELVAATAILCVYEFLDASGMEWSRHLDGAKSLIDVAKDSMEPLTLPSSPTVIAHHALPSTKGHAHNSAAPAPTSSIPRFSKGHVAVFWNFARQDMLSAFINNTSTRFNTEDLSMWKSAGLRLSSEGLVCPSNPQHEDYLGVSAMQDDMICNALIWLMAKMVNFITSYGCVFERLSPPPGSTLQQHYEQQQQLSEQWYALEGQFQYWCDGLPETFQPTAATVARDADGIEEKWFSRSMCASTMQSYHFARIQLLHHKPRVSSGRAAYDHTDHEQLLQQSRFHAKEIVTIGLSRADEGARVHAVQPLWTAGLVLGAQPIEDDDTASVDKETWTWRRVIVSQLRAIEKDMGWASEYRVQNLLSLWNLPPDWPPESTKSAHDS